MSALTKTRWYIFAGLLLSASATWGQALFADHVIGDASSCVTKHYHKAGTPVPGYFVKGSTTANACGLNGTATAKSTASVGPPNVSASAITAKAKSGDVAVSDGNSFDTAILTPPSGWAGGPVSVILKTSYRFNVKNVTVTAPGALIINWYIEDQVVQHVATATNGNGEVNVSVPLEIEPNANGTYEFKVTVEGEAGATASSTGGPSVSLSTGYITFVLPDKNWKCVYASNALATCDE